MGKIIYLALLLLLSASSLSAKSNKFGTTICERKNFAEDSEITLFRTDTMMFGSMRFTNVKATAQGGNTNFSEMNKVVILV